MRGSRPGKNVQLTESEIRGLCLKSREIFLSQPILLELEAPLKICGMYMTRFILFHGNMWLIFIVFAPEGNWVSKMFQVTFTASIMIFSGYLNMEGFLQSRITCFWETMLTEESSHLRQFVFSLHTRLNTQRISFCSGVTMNVQASIGYMVSMMNVRFILINH